MINQNIAGEACGKYLRLSQHKTRKVLDQIRGKNYQEARIILEFMPYKACKSIIKIIESAASNLMNNHNVTSKEDLIIKEAFANEGPKLKRFQPRAQGRAFAIRKPTCHIIVKIEQMEKS
uniref:Large ribosomal subunit protein uL22c n=1 Tax=Spyridia filamentosa TaxID=196632 RepID=A0A1Z1MJM0_SPYFI|nr:ribosomal protein L22 [Spyridia filamentosa]ARW66253.1 ribosomal protein L22 [Spyridia filamentosa]